MTSTSTILLPGTTIGLRKSDVLAMLPRCSRSERPSVSVDNLTRSGRIKAAKASFILKDVADY